MSNSISKLKVLQVGNMTIIQIIHDNFDILESLVNKKQNEITSN